MQKLFLSFPLQKVLKILSMKILICPLNWGLGHASRCVPIIRQFIAEGHEPVLVSDGYPLEFLKQEFPTLRFIEFPSYKVYYSAGKSQVGAMLFNLPNIISGILGIILMVLAGIFILTSLISFCPLYLPFGLSTNKGKE